MKEFLLREFTIKTLNSSIDKIQKEVTKILKELEENNFFVGKWSIGTNKLSVYGYDGYKKGDDKK